MNKDNILFTFKVLKEIGVVGIIWTVFLIVGITAKYQIELPKQIIPTATAITKHIDARLDKIQTDLNTHLTTIETKTDKQVTKLQTNVKEVVTGVLDKTNDKVNKALDIVSEKTQNTLDIADNRLGEVTSGITGVKSDVDQVTKSFTVDLPNYINDQYGTFIDCKVNAYCVPNLAVDTLIAARESSRNISLTMDTLNKTTLPQFTSQFASIGKNVDGITANVKKLTTVHWYDRVIGYSLNAGLIYGQAHAALAGSVVAVVKDVSSQK